MRKPTNNLTHSSQRLLSSAELGNTIGGSDALTTPAPPPPDTTIKYPTIGVSVGSGYLVPTGGTDGGNLWLGAGYKIDI